MVEETRSALGAARGEEQAEPQGFIDQIWTKFTSTRISYRNGWNTEALIFENLKPVEITKTLFQHHLNTLKKSINFQN